MAQVSNRVHAVRLAQCKEVELQLEAHGKVGGGGVWGGDNHPEFNGGQTPAGGG